MAREDGRDAEAMWYVGLDKNLSADGDSPVMACESPGSGRDVVTLPGVEPDTEEDASDVALRRDLPQEVEDVQDDQANESFGEDGKSPSRASVRPASEAADEVIDDRFSDVDIAAPVMSTSSSVSRVVDSKEVELYDKRLSEASRSSFSLSIELTGPHPISVEGHRYALDGALKVREKVKVIEDSRASHDACILVAALKASAEAEKKASAEAENKKAASASLWLNEATLEKPKRMTDEERSKMASLFAGMKLMGKTVVPSKSSALSTAPVMKTVRAGVPDDEETAGVEQEDQYFKQTEKDVVEDDTESQRTIPLVYFCRNKTAKEVLLATQKLVAAAREITKEPIYRLHSDGGGEFGNEEMEKFAAEQGLKKTCRSPEDPQGNAICERQIGLIKSTARALLIDASLSPLYWQQAVEHATWLRRQKAMEIPISKALPIFGQEVVVTMSVSSFGPRGFKGKYLGVVSNAASAKILRPDGTVGNYASLRKLPAGHEKYTEKLDPVHVYAEEVKGETPAFASAGPSVPPESAAAGLSMPLAAGAAGPSMLPAAGKAVPLMPPAEAAAGPVGATGGGSSWTCGATCGGRTCGAVSPQD